MCLQRQILATDFENELEFYILLGIDKNGIISIYDNETGLKIHEFRIGLNLDEVIILYDFYLKF